MEGSKEPLGLPPIVDVDGVLVEDFGGDAGICVVQLLGELRAEGFADERVEETEQVRRVVRTHDQVEVDGPVQIRLHVVPERLTEPLERGARGRFEEFVAEKRHGREQTEEALFANERLNPLLDGLSAGDGVAQCREFATEAAREATVLHLKDAVDDAGRDQTAELAGIPLALVDQDVPNVIGQSPDPIDDGLHRGGLDGL